MISAAFNSGDRSTAVRRPFARSLVWLVGLGAFFYASYGFTNWLAGQHGDVPAIVFDWERHIPFISWTIFPYWTTNLFYAASLLLCRTRVELDTHARRLLTAQLVAIACFILFPLKFSWPKPEVLGFFGFFYEALGAFDKPYNQAPSLHVALTVILSAFYFRLLPPVGRAIFAGWSALVVVSVLTTFQHHFIDVPLGFALGLFCVWAWPFEGAGRATAWQLSADPRCLRLFASYAAGAMAVTAAAFWIGGWGLWLLWPALAFGCVALAYLGFGSALFGRSRDGRMDVATRLLLLPYLVSAWVNSRLWTARDAASVAIAGNVYLGRFPSEKDAVAYASVVDLTAEFVRPTFHGQWSCFPMLDLVAPAPHTLRAAADAIEAQVALRPVLVCCALGYGRSVATVATWLVRSGHAPSVEAAIDILWKKRPRLSLAPDQIAAIAEAVHDD